MDTPTLNVNRRDLMLAGAGAVVIPGLALGAESDPQSDRDPWMDDPQKCFVNYVRLMGDTSGRLSPQWWRGSYMGVFGDRNFGAARRARAGLLGQENRRAIVSLGLAARQFMKLPF